MVIAMHFFILHSKTVRRKQEFYISRGNNVRDVPADNDSLQFFWFKRMNVSSDFNACARILNQTTDIMCFAVLCQFIEHNICLFN